MAIVNMKKLSVIALKEKEKDIVDTLMSIGVTQINEIDTIQFGEEYEGLFSECADEELLLSYDTQLKTVKQAIDILASYVNVKKAMFAPRKSISKKLFSEIVDSYDQKLELAENVCALRRREDEIKSEQNHIQSEIDSLAHWDKLYFVPTQANTKNTRVILGTMPISKDICELEKAMDEEGVIAYADCVGEGKDLRYIYVVFHASCEQELMHLLSGFDFSSQVLSIEETPMQIITKLKSELALLDEEKKQNIEQLKMLAADKLQLEALYDYISECIEKEKTILKLAHTEYTIMLSGWVPAEAADVVAKVLGDKFICETVINEPTEEEAYPILLRNPKIIQPFESVTEMYSLPAPHSMDPNKVMAPFFFLFFGMMVSDAGYGVILTLATAFMLWKFKPKGQAHKLISLICFGGISTIIWGVIFGGYFGDTLQVAYKMATGKNLVIPSLLNPSADPISVLVLSLILGLIHIFAGMGAKAYMLIKRGNIWAAVFDIGFWYLVLGGLGVLCLGLVMPTTPVMKIGTWIAISGAVGLILTQGREKKNIFAKLIGGIGSLYDIVSYLSDLLSYSRLLALGLSTGVVASVVNTMGSMGGNNIIGWILFAAVFLIGHLLNIAINTLGAYVHSSRLQYVEFFSKFYESGGKAFRPLVRPRKYVDIVDDISNAG